VLAGEGGRQLQKGRAAPVAQALQPVEKCARLGLGLGPAQALVMADALRKLEAEPEAGVSSRQRSTVCRRRLYGAKKSLGREPAGKKLPTHDLSPHIGAPR
jgi:hypothetical protein